MSVKEQKDSKKSVKPKTYYGFGRSFKRCENCLHATTAKGACKSGNKVFCKNLKRFVHKKAELMCFNVMPLDFRIIMYRG